MSIQLKQEQLDRYMDVMKWQKGDAYVYARIAPQGEMILNLFGLTPLASRHIVIAFTSELIAFIEIDPWGKFQAKHVSISMEDFESIAYKSGKWHDSLLFETDRHKMSFKIPHTVASLEWQGENIEKVQSLIESDWKS